MQTKLPILSGDPEDTQRFRSLIHAELALSSRLSTIRDGLSRLIGLTAPQYTVLMSIHHLQATGDVNVKSVSDLLCVSGTFVTSEINKLVELELVEKTRDDSDQRRVKLAVTRLGRQRIHKISPIEQKVNSVHFGWLNSRELNDLYETLNRLVLKADQSISLLTHLSGKHKS